MKKKIIGMLVCLLLVATALLAVGEMNEIVNGESIASTYGPLDGGWLEERDGVTILHLGGSYYEMGYQYGLLLKDKIQENLRAQLALWEQREFSYDEILKVWNIMKNYLPPDYKNEMQGMAEGSGIPFEEIAVLNTMPAIFNHAYAGSCCGVAAWGSATSDGELYHLRGFDWSLDIMDPETGTYLHETLVLIVRDPDNGYASLYPEFAGNICCWSGINEKGIGIGEMTCLTNDTTFRGISAAFRMRMVLDHASTAEEAINIMNSKRTCGWNFIISDGKIPIGYAAEQTANLSYVGTWDNPVESTSPFWAIEDVVRRFPMFIYPECAATQKDRDSFDPSSPNGLLLYFLGKNPYFSKWAKYEALSDEIEKQWGTLDLNSIMSILRDVYLGKTYSSFTTIIKLRGPTSTLFQWVAYPKAGDMLISFAGDGKRAFENPVHYFNLYELLDSGGANNPPNKPSKPSGTTNGKAGKEYTYYSTATDPDGDQIYYRFDWGDGSYTNTELYDSGTEGNASHVWEKGSWEIKVKAIDEPGAGSEWSDPLVVSMPKSKQLINLELGIYVENVKERSFPITIVVGDIDIEVDATDDDGIDRVEFYIDEELKETVTEKPYVWTWDEFSFGRHTLTVEAYDNTGNSDTDEMTVYKFF